jgi:hypothetical protein
MSCVATLEPAVFKEAKIKKTGVETCIRKIHIMKRTSGEIGCGKYGIGKIIVVEYGIGQHEIVMPFLVFQK